MLVSVVGTGLSAGLIGKPAEYVSCFGSGTIRKELIQCYGSPFAVEKNVIFIGASDEAGLNAKQIVAQALLALGAEEKAAVIRPVRA